MVVSQGDIWWAALPVPSGSEPGFTRPIVIIQGNPLNRSRIATILCVPLTSNLKWETAPGNVLLKAKATGLAKDSVALVSQVTTLDKSSLLECCGKVSAAKLDAILSGLDVVLDR